MLDEMYSPEIARRLRKQGHDVVAVKERPGLIEIRDPQLFALMASEGRAIVINNAQDFVKLFNQAAVAGDDHYGLFLTDDRSMPRRKETIGLFVRVLDELLRRNPSDDAFRNRIRWLP